MNPLRENFMFSKGLISLLFFPALVLANDCGEQPTAPESIPKGATASEQDMVAASQEVREFVQVGQQYTKCLQPMIDEAKKAVEAAEEGTPQHEAVSKELVVLVYQHDTLVDKMKAVADEFNGELQAYNSQASSGG